MKNTEKTMEKIVNLCKGRGFIFSGSEIYGGLANTSFPYHNPEWLYTVRSCPPV